jgi:hypothetical protein
LIFHSLLLVVAGCSVIDVHVKIDPAGGALTDSTACLYEFDRRGLWYVLFLMEDGLLAAVHRHNPGIHLFIDSDENMIFYARCSGRGEAIDVMGKTMKLADGAVFLCDVRDGNPQVMQLPIKPPECDGNDPRSVAKAIYDVSQDPRVAEYLDAESRARLLAAWQTAQKAK